MPEQPAAVQPVAGSGAARQPAGLPPPEGATSSAASGPSAELGTPWERRRELGLFEAWKRTVLLALFEPGKLFAQARLDRGRDQLWFALITGSVFWAVGQILDRLLLSGQREQAQRMIDEIRRAGPQLPAIVQGLLNRSTEPETIGSTVLLALLAPLFTFLLIYFNAGITHGSALLLGNAKRGFAASFAAATYGLTPMVLLVVPGCGGIVALIWSAILIGVGMKVTHRITTGGAAATVLAPYLFLCCGGCLVTVAAAAMFGRNMAAGAGLP